MTSARSPLGFTTVSIHSLEQKTTARTRKDPGPQTTRKTKRKNPAIDPTKIHVLRLQAWLTDWIADDSGAAAPHIQSKRELNLETPAVIAGGRSFSSGGREGSFPLSAANRLTGGPNVN
jgi:hypothetical protein